jgi:hypothetical protein
LRAFWAIEHIGINDADTDQEHSSKDNEAQITRMVDGRYIAPLSWKAEISFCNQIGGWPKDD